MSELTLSLTPPRSPMRCTKWRYPDKKAVNSAINERMRGAGSYGEKRRRQKRGRPEFLRSYFCNECHAWHITHRPDYFKNDDSDSRRPQRRR
jgi:hypothetical protein